MNANAYDAVFAGSVEAVDKLLQDDVSWSVSQVTWTKLRVAVRDCVMDIPFRSVTTIILEADDEF